MSQKTGVGRSTFSGLVGNIYIYLFIYLYIFIFIYTRIMSLNPSNRIHLQMIVTYIVQSSPAIPIIWRFITMLIA
jgi:hypothetical protein